TLWARCMRRQIMPLPPADIIVVDEAHHVVAQTYARIIEAYPDAVVLGATATPARGDGRGLGGVFNIMIKGPQVRELIDQYRVLVRTRVYAPARPDLRGVKTLAGDYVESQLAERMDTATLVGDIPTQWLRYGKRQKTVCFCTGVDHSV